MNYFKNIMLFAVVAFFVSCSSKDDTPTPPSEATGIAGEWTMEEYHYEGSSSVSQENFTYTTYYSGEARDINAKVTFSEDPDTWKSEGNYTMSLKTSVDGETEEKEIIIDDFSGSGTFSIDNDQIFIDNQTPGYPEPGEMSPMDINEATITELSSNRLILTFSEHQTVTQDGMVAETVIDGVQVYSR